VMNFGPQTKKSYCAHIDTPEVLVRCKLTQVHTPRGSMIQFLESFARIAARGIYNI